MDALYALLREQRPASAECAYRILEALATNDDEDEPLSHAVGRVVYARELRKLGKVAACDVTFDGMLRAALESGLPVCVLEKVRGAWDEARDVRERVASRRGTVEVVVDAKRAEDAARAEAELLSLLDDEEAKASRASKKKQKRKKKKAAAAPVVVEAPAVVADDEPDSDSDGEANLLRLARHAPEQAPAEAPAPAPAARRRRKGKKAAPVVVELPPAPARPVPAGGQGAGRGSGRSRQTAGRCKSASLCQGRCECSAAPHAGRAGRAGRVAVAGRVRGALRLRSTRRRRASPPSGRRQTPSANRRRRGGDTPAAAAPFGFSMGGDPAPAQLGAEASPSARRCSAVPAAPGARRGSRRGSRERTNVPCASGRRGSAPSCRAAIFCATGARASTTTAAGPVPSAGRRWSGSMVETTPILGALSMETRT